jgi:tetratricopeptide (TPR) repeat protein
MADNQRIDDLRRRVQKDPASIAFAQLAEECRRAGQYEESIEVCRAGLDIHPAYLSARVTLGRALIEINALDDAQTELELVLRSAPENLAAIRGLAEIHHRRGSLPEALAQYRAALGLARNDPDLERTVAELERAVEPPKPPASADGLSFDEVQEEFLKNLPPPPPRPPPPLTPPPESPRTVEFDAGVLSTDDAPPPVPLVLRPFDELRVVPSEVEGRQAQDERAVEEPAVEPPTSENTPVAQEEDAPVQFVENTDERGLAMKTIVALEEFLDAIHVPRTQPSA